MKLQYVLQVRFLSLVFACAFAFGALLVPYPVAAAGMVGTGTPASCTEAAFRAALAAGGNVTFNCGSAPHTIPLTTSNNVVATTSIDGGGLISLSGGTTTRVFYIDDATLNLSNITIRDTGTAEFQIGLTIENRGTLNIAGVTFVNNNKRAILNAGAGTTLTVAGSRFEDNTSSASGSAISNESGASLTVADSVFVNNRAPSSYSGGAIYNGGEGSTATISRSLFNGNSAGGGGAIVNFGTMALSDSLLSGNTAVDGGGAIEARSNATLNITNTTISGNTARRGGGIYGVGPIPSTAATLTNVTLAGNTAPADAANQGGGNITIGGQVSITLRNTIVAGPGSTSSNCKNDSSGGAGITDGGNNLQYPGATCGAATGADPRLGALEDNGGLTATHALAADSPARDAANNAYCAATDQRGVVRPQGAACDIGAFEYGATPVLSSFSPVCGPTGRAFTLTVNGANFITGAKGSRIVLNGTALATTLVSPTQLSAVVPAGMLTGPTGSTVPLAVQTPVVDGGTSAPLAFTICNRSSVYIPTAAR